MLGFRCRPSGALPARRRLSAGAAVAALCLLAGGCSSDAPNGTGTPGDAGDSSSAQETPTTTDPPGSQTSPAIPDRDAEAAACGEMVALGEELDRTEDLSLIAPAVRRARAAAGGGEVGRALGRLVDQIAAFEEIVNRISLPPSQEDIDRLQDIGVKAEAALDDVVSACRRAG